MGLQASPAMEKSPLLFSTLAAAVGNCFRTCPPPSPSPAQPVSLPSSWGANRVPKTTPNYKVPNWPTLQLPWEDASPWLLGELWASWGSGPVSVEGDTGTCPPWGQRADGPGGFAGNKSLGHSTHNIPSSPQGQRVGGTTGESQQSGGRWPCLSLCF